MHNNVLHIYNTAYNTSGYHGIHPAGLHGPGGILSCIAPRKTFTRNRRQAKRETRLWEKEERRRRTEVEEKKKKKSADYFRALLAHRDEFVRFHKNKRIGDNIMQCNALTYSIFVLLRLYIIRLLNYAIE